MTAAEVVLSYHNVTKSFGAARALDGVELEIKRGEIFGFIGPDGAGKTTMMRMAMGIINPDEGECLLLGSADRRAARVRAGYVPQLFSLYTNMSVMENIRLFGSLYGKPEKAVEERAEFILSRVGLWGFRDRFAGNLSGGMKQKLAIISAWIHEPKLIIMDEPFVGLDPAASHLLKGMMREVCNSGGAIFFSTHVLEVAEKLCDKVAIIKSGKLIRSGTMEEVKGDSSLENVFLELEGEEC